MPKKVTIYTDGGAKGNPGPAAGAAALEVAGNLQFFCGKYLGVKTNNEAEYEAVVWALETLKERTDSRNLSVEIRSDSNLIVNQLNGVFKLKEESLRGYIFQIRSLETNFFSVTYTFIPR